MLKRRRITADLGRPAGDMSTIKAILFDKDGTLIDFAATYGPATASVIERLSAGNDDLALAMADAVAFDPVTLAFRPDSIVIAGTGNEIARAWFVLREGWNHAELAQRVDAAYEEFAVKHVAPFAETRPALERLVAMGLHLGIATNDSEEGARRHRRALGFETLLPFLAGYDSGHGAKPGPGMVQAFARHHGLSASEIAMVGDSLHDMHCARAAGALAVAVTTGMADAQVLEPHADHVLGGIGELAGLVEAINAAGG